MELYFNLLEQKKNVENYENIIHLKKIIEKVINPLFLKELNDEYQEIINEGKGNKKSKLSKLQDKLSSLQLLDSACGCGNFLIVAYSKLRDIETRIIKELYAEDAKSVQQVFEASIIRKVRLAQLHGIEIDPFPQMIAKTAAWLQDHLSNEKLSKLVGEHIPTIPLSDSANIIQGNALQLDLETCFPDMKEKEFSYIFGNPPFNGTITMSKEQKEDMKQVFGELKGIGDLDYVTAWYWKAASYLERYNNCSVAYVSTNSTVQGQQVGILWKQLFKNIFINFAYRTFKWINEANGMAAVHCVIIGIKSNKLKTNEKLFIYHKKNICRNVKRINHYLLDTTIDFIDNRENPICNVPKMNFGNQIIDDGNYIFSKDERDDFIKNEIQSEKYFFSFLGAREFLHNEMRYILMVNMIPLSTLKNLPLTKKRILNVQKYREQSKRISTKKLADTPKKFQTTFIPNNNYIVVPEISSEKRFYIPIGILSKDIIASHRLKIIDSSSLYLFGILTSSVYMIWMRLVAGRLEMRYTYSIGIVYNNFP